MPIAVHAGFADFGLFAMSGQIAPKDFAAIQECYLSDGGAAVQRDALYFVRPGTDYSAIGLEAMSAIRNGMISAFRAVPRHIVVRTAFVCLEPRALPAVEAWRDMTQDGDGMASEVGVFETLAAAAEWLALTPAECAEVEARLAGSAAA